MGSAAMDKTGGIAVGYNISSSRHCAKHSLRLSRGLRIRWELGQRDHYPSRSWIANGNLTRWGDYTISVDPVDGCTMVFTTQFQPANGNFNWNTYIHSFKLSTCN